jgi:alkylation response protein AidB-like acyl-CoA dehydrogenase
MEQLTDEQQTLKHESATFADQEIKPVALELAKAKAHPFDIIEKAGDHGFAAPGIPENYGGAGHTVFESALIWEELCRGDASIGSSLISMGYGSHMLIGHGDEWMKDEWLPKFATGEAISATAVTEPEHGSNPAGMETTAEKDGDEWVINGTKRWTTNGTVADMCIVLAKTDPGAGHRGISAFLVPTDTDGYNAVEIEDKMGLNACDEATVSLDGIRVPEDHLIGTENEGFYQLMEFFNHSRLCSAAFSVGATQGALSAAIDYAGDREQSGQTIDNYQAIRHKIADMDMKLAAGRSLCYRSARCIDADAEDSTRVASIAKLYTSEVAEEVTSDAIQIHGANGYTDEYRPAKYYRDVRAAQIWEGTSEIQRNIIASNLLD